jgi:hypothetical protein
MAAAITVATRRRQSQHHRPLRAIRIDDEGLAKPKLLDRRCHRVYSGIVLAGIARVGFDVGEFP